MAGHGINSSESTTPFPSHVSRPVLRIDLSESGIRPFATFLSILCDPLPMPSESHRGCVAVDHRPPTGFDFFVAA
ncbi:hypothetical protein BG842_07040 [Haladaptatus sp. W1]|nr:hypothetical protein BG842_07040 [Haladaptatus sp. W1]